MTFDRPLTVSRPELLSGDGDGEFRQLVHDLLTIASHMQAVRDGIGDLVGLTGPQYSIVMAIAQLAGDTGVTVKDVAAHLHVSPPFVTTETGKLIRGGYLEKRSDAEDRRRVRLNLTSAGEEAVRYLTPDLRRINDVLFGALDAEGFDRLRQLTADMVPYAESAVALLDPVLRRA